jgi:hypothetical protein
MAFGNENTINNNQGLGEGYTTPRAKSPLTSPPPLIRDNPQVLAPVNLWDFFGDAPAENQIPVIDLTPGQ